ncbi:hypothetical protein OG889_19735 [Streptomyces sp. NBC_00481]|uniref:hypothetical protein n=1 Tax=Streptomyces sp. NBC_00481 TaxID=2975755 RepID=UPI002DD8DDF8|nr:hypothetical protein [Streptomyces sp. NBC_00481]WRY96779.1 hypothetical protein OG889_19735 [Streptomyces sp. NBC_00481]
MTVALLTLGVLLFVALVVVASLVVPIVVVIKRGGLGDGPGLGPPRPPRRHDNWWANAARAPWPDGEGDSHGHGDSSSCGDSGGGSSCGGGSSSSSCGSNG